MFERINTGSKIANKAEVRRGALAGPFMKLVADLSQLELFTTLAPVSKKEADEREREELITRFFAYADGLEGYRDRPSEFLFKYVKEMNIKIEQDAGLIEEYRQRFVSTMTFVQQVFPHGFRKNPKGTATPRARFEAIAIGSRMALDENPALTATQVPDVSPWLNDTDFARVVGSDGANAIARLRQRMKFVHDKLVS